MTTTPRILTALLAAALTGACTPCRCLPPAGAAPAPQGAYRGPLVSSLQVEMVGDSIRLGLQVTNASDAPVQLGFASGQSYDFQVRRAGETVWTWSADRSFMQALRTETLAPGETRSYTEFWRPGEELRGATLTAVGTLTSTDHAVEQAAEFQLP